MMRPCAAGMVVLYTLGGAQLAVAQDCEFHLDEAECTAFGCTWDGEACLNPPASDCPPGTADHDSEPATPCVSCAAGQYGAGGSAPCEDCMAGTADDDSDPSTACVVCADGTHAEAGSTSCEHPGPSCQDFPDEAECIAFGCTWDGEACLNPPASDCPPGTADHDSEPATPCVSCAAGQYGAGGSAPCEDCMAGTADDDSDPSTACVVCADGTHAEAGSTSCEHPGPSCQDFPDEAECIAFGCTWDGEACLNPPASDCPPGTADHDSEPATPCVSCAAGQYGAGGSAPCEDCMAGTADDDSDPSTACVVCADGTHAEAGSTSCEHPGPSCQDFPDEAECIAFGCTWGGEACLNPTSIGCDDELAQRLLRLEEEPGICALRDADVTCESFVESLFAAGAEMPPGSEFLMTGCNRAACEAAGFGWFDDGSRAGACTYLAHVDTLTSGHPEHNTWQDVRTICLANDPALMWITETELSLRAELKNRDWASDAKRMQEDRMWVIDQLRKENAELEKTVKTLSGMLQMTTGRRCFGPQ